MITFMIAIPESSRHHTVPFLRFAARAVVFAFLAFPLTALALELQSKMPQLPPMEDVALMIGFVNLEAVLLLFVMSLFKRVP